MLATPSAGHQELRSPADDREAMPNELLQHLFERERARLAVDEREQDDREAVLDWRELVELVQHHIWIGVLLEVDNDSHRLVEIALVAHAGNARDAALVRHVRNLLDDGITRLLIRNVVD